MSDTQSLIANITELVVDLRNLARSATGLISLIERERLHPPKFLTSEELRDRMLAYLELHQSRSLDDAVDRDVVASDIAGRLAITTRVMER